jgi:hypothetical protein
MVGPLLLSRYDKIVPLDKISLIVQHISVGKKNQTEWKLCKRNRFIVDGKKLSDARMAANMSMEDVAEALSGCNGNKVNKSSVSRWEQESLVPSEERIFKMAEMFKTMAFVIGNPDYKKPE